MHGTGNIKITRGCSTVRREIFGRKIEEEVTGEWTKLYTADSHDSFSSPNIILSTVAIPSSRVR
jgi:hypothetical protein